MIELPTEIILQIADYLDSNDIISLSSVSHYHRDILKYLAFKTIIFDNVDHQIIDLWQQSLGFDFLSAIGPYVNSIEYIVYPSNDNFTFIAFEFPPSSGSLHFLLSMCPNLKKISILAIQNYIFPLCFVPSNINQINELEIISTAGIMTTNIKDHFFKYQKLINKISLNQDPDEFELLKDCMKITNKGSISIDFPKSFKKLKNIYLRGYKLPSNFINKISQLHKLKNISLVDCAIDPQEKLVMNMDSVIPTSHNINNEYFRPSNKIARMVKPQRINLIVEYSNFYRSLKDEHDLLQLKYDANQMIKAFTSIRNQY